ncbi:Mu transposase C-terminal domain-containing protein [Microbacterium sp. 1P06AB]|uniref:Mu transposase C-terminal domain-containing protein n=1 Tax=Microbacterium sp. 1P06AB TaxID=3132289 RepID=UPI0039A469B9
MTTPRTVTIGQTVELKDGIYTLVAHQDDVFRLRNELTGKYSLVHLTELGRLLAPGKPLSTENAPKRTVADALSRLSEDSRKLIPHLEELINGTPAVGNEPRAQYSLDKPVKWRQEAKLLELDRLGIDMSLSSLKRRIAEYKSHGPAGLMDKRQNRTANPKSRIDDKVKNALAELLATYENRSSPTYSAVRAELHTKLYEMYPDAGDRPSTPSISTVERYVQAITGASNPTKSAKRRRTDALVPNKPFNSRLVAAPGDEVQVDSTWFDAFVRMPDKTVIRPWLSILIDKQTRSILSFNFTAGAPTGDDHAITLARALVPRKLKPWKKHYEALDLPKMPWAPYVDEKDGIDTYRPYIVPRRILTDNGPDYLGATFLSACARYGIDRTEAPPFSPTSKAKVERNFRTIKTKFTQFLPGYVSGDINGRGEAPEKEGVLDLDTVVELFDRWVNLVWQNRQHKGLRDPYDRAIKHTPNSLYAASVEVTGVFLIPLDADDYIALMPRESRTVQLDGIKLLNRKYDSPHLAPMRREKDSDGNSVEYDVHYDPNDLSQVWVRSTIDSQWISCGWVEEAGLRRPNHRTIMEAAASATRNRKGFTDSRADELMVMLRGEAIAEEKEARLAAAAEERRRAKDAVASERRRVAPMVTDSFTDFLDLETL